MPKENLVASEETKEFYRELPLPNGFNGNEVNGKVYFEAVLSPSKTFVSLATLTESFRRMQDFYDTMNSGRFFLCQAQRASFHEVYTDDKPLWADFWVRSQFVDSAIHCYSAAFDLYLQIVWICFEIYKSTPKVPNTITNKKLKKILEACNIGQIERTYDKLDKTLVLAIEKFRKEHNTKLIRNLCKQLKHRQKISYKELSGGKRPILIMSDSYNSHKTISDFTLSDVIQYLKIYHENLKILADNTISIFKAHLSKV